MNFDCGVRSPIDLAVVLGKDEQALAGVRPGQGHVGGQDLQLGSEGSGLPEGKEKNDRKERNDRFPHGTPQSFPQNNFARLHPSSSSHFWSPQCRHRLANWFTIRVPTK